MPTPIMIAVIGENDPSPELAALAEAVGAEIAAAGAVLVCGGLGGIMEAACRGAHSRGGTSLGLLPGTNREDANRYVTYPLPTGLGHVRNILVVRIAQAVIAIGGRYGTLSEIAFAKINGTPIIGLHTWELKREGLKTDAIQPAEGAEQAVAMALEAARRRTGQRVNSLSADYAESWKDRNSKESA